jgi:hypothetical protein
MSGPDGYGRYYWCVRLPGREEIYLYADSVQFVNGSLVFIREKADKATGKAESKVNFVFAPGHWENVFAASHIDGGAVAVEHWFKNGKPKQKIGFAEPTEDS